MTENHCLIFLHSGFLLNLIKKRARDKPASKTSAAAQLAMLFPEDLLSLTVREQISLTLLLVSFMNKCSDKVEFLILHAREESISDSS